MSLHGLYEPVETLLRQTATDIVMPRFQALAAHEISEKSPGDIVTIADRESEERLSAGLAGLLPDARIVGEEAAANDLALLDDLDSGTIWLIDPIDGTTNFFEGKTPFALMIGLLIDGETEAGWIYDPVMDRLCHAHRHYGAFVNSEKITGKSTGNPLPVTALAMHFLPPDRRADLEARAQGKFTVVPIPRCAGEQYPRLALGENDISLFEKALPYDHAAGELFLREAGGKTAKPDGTPYQPADRRPGLLSASNSELWDQAAETLFG